MSTAVSPRRSNPWVVGVVAGMASYIDAAALVGIGIALAIYQPTLGLTGNQIGLASGVLTLCVAFGAVVGGRLGDNLGRRRVFLATMVLVASGAALAVFATTFTPLMVGVVLMGLGVGADLPTSLATIAESASDDNRGKILSLSGILWLLGIIGAIAIASFAGGWGRAGAQLLIGQVGVVAVLVFLGRLPMPESQAWFAQRERRRLLGPDADGPKRSLRDLLRPPYLAPLAALVIFYSLTNIGANTSGQFNSYIATNYAGTTIATYNKWALVGMIVSIGGGLVFMRIVDTRFRMPFYIVGMVLIVASYLVYAVFGLSLRTMVVQLFLSGLGNCFAFEGIMKVWTQESFPTLLRSTAQGTVLAVARAIAAIAGFATPALLRMSAVGGYVGLGVLAAIGLVVGYLAFRGTNRNEFVEEAAEASSGVSSPSTVTVS